MDYCSFQLDCVEVCHLTGRRDVLSVFVSVYVRFGASLRAPDAKLIYAEQHASLTCIENKTIMRLAGIELLGRQCFRGTIMNFGIFGPSAIVLHCQGRS